MMQAEPCPVCEEPDQGGWCESCYDLYAAYLETHPIPARNRFDPRNLHEPAHQPAYMLDAAEWSSIGFDPQYLLNPASAPPPTRKKAHVMSQQQTETTEDMMRRLIAEQIGSPAQPSPNQSVSVDDLLEQIDPRDSDTALKLFNWLRDNARLHKIATLDQGGYLFLYQEPEGSSKAGYIAGGTQGDRIVDDALEKAQASGDRPVKGLCKKCFSPIVQIGNKMPEAESPRPGTNPAECGGGGPHEFAG